MGARKVEIGVGVFVALGVVAFIILAMKVSNLSDFAIGEGYSVEARFDNVGGLKVRSAVSMGGVRIGRVASIEYDDTTYEAVVTMVISPHYRRIPTDSSASIYTAGLLGEQYVGVEAGGEEEFLAAGGRITLTQSAVVLEQLIGQFLYSKAGEGG
jgi:phospholipid/cholesterol/gamma-HCH transport system substrate-binding protein